MTRRKPTANSPSRHASGPARDKGSRAQARHTPGGKPGPKTEQGGKPPARYGDAPRGERGEGGDRPPSRQGFAGKPGFGGKPGFAGKPGGKGGKPGFGPKKSQGGGSEERFEPGRGPRRDAERAPGRAPGRAADRAPEFAPRPGRDAAGERLERPARPGHGPKKDYGKGGYAGRPARSGGDDRKGPPRGSDYPPGPKKVHRDARPPSRHHGGRAEGGRGPERHGDAPRPERSLTPRGRPAAAPVDDFDLDDDIEPIVAPPARTGIEKSGRRSGIRTDQWLYGPHAVLAALANPRRHCDRLVLTDTMAEHLGTKLDTLGGPQAEILTKDEIERLLPPGAVHQGIAVAVEPLEEPDLADILAALPPGRGLVVILDQVTDPHNVGAVLRSAAAFGADAVILPDRHAPGATGVLAKAASGALDAVPLLHVVNLSRAMDELKTAGFWCVGFDSEAGQPVAAADLTGRVVLVLGAEGAGLRRLTRERCDLLVRLPTQGTLLSLNVSNAAAVALYEVARRR